MLPANLPPYRLYQLEIASRSTPRNRTHHEPRSIHPLISQHIDPKTYQFKPPRPQSCLISPEIVYGDGGSASVRLMRNILEERNHVGVLTESSNSKWGGRRNRLGMATRRIAVRKSGGERKVMAKSITSKNGAREIRMLSGSAGDRRVMMKSRGRNIVLTRWS